MELKLLYNSYLFVVKILPSDCEILCLVTSLSIFRASKCLLTGWLQCGMVPWLQKRRKWSFFLSWEPINLETPFSKLQIMSQLFRTISNRPIYFFLPGSIITVLIIPIKSQFPFMCWNPWNHKFRKYYVYMQKYIHITVSMCQYMLILLSNMQINKRRFVKHGRCRRQYNSSVAPLSIFL